MLILLRRVSLTLLVFVHVAATQVRAEPAMDKTAHFGIAATAQTLCTTLGRGLTDSKWGSTITCFILVNSVGVAKEYSDQKREGHYAEAGDMVANFAGSGFSAALISIGF